MCVCVCVCVRACVCVCMMLCACLCVCEWDTKHINRGHLLQKKGGRADVDVEEGETSSQGMPISSDTTSSGRIG